MVDFTDHSNKCTSLVARPICGRGKNVFPPPTNRPGNEATCVAMYLSTIQGGRYSYLSDPVLSDVEALEVGPEAAAVLEVQLRYGIAVELQVLETTRLPGIGRRQQRQLVLCGIHCADTGREGETILHTL